MSAIRCLIVGLVFVTVGFAPAPFPKKERGKNRDDLEVMQGMWRMTRYEMSGSSTDSNYKVRIRNDKWTFFRIVNGQEQESSTYTLKLDPKQAPKAFEWKSHPAPGSNYVGSYRLEGRRLTVIFGSGTFDQMQTRPIDFNGKPSYLMAMEYIGRQ